MANDGKTVATAYVQIVPSAKDIKSKLVSLMGGDAASAGASAGEAMGTSMGSSLVSKFGKLGIAAAIASVIKKSLDAGADLQQSFGGLETIYGDAADAAKEYAAQAAASGISMNDYAEQAVSFGASLKQAFGGDTRKAVEAANTAILDMTDNAAKMGTPIESIQNAYQGFAKGQYTMLDNLKLGYGGTKTEMMRLLADAEKLTGVKYDISNLGDVYSAIHAIQGELGLTGTAAEEAQTTLSGAMNAMKASIQNVLASMSTGLDVSQPLTQMLNQINTFSMNNLIPMILNIVNAIPAVLKNAPDILQAGVDVGMQLINGIAMALPEIFEAAGRFIMEFIAGIGNAIPKILNAGQNIIIGLVDGILSAIPAILDSADGIIKAFSDGLTECVPILVEGASRLLIATVSHLPEILASLANAGPEIIEAIIESLFSAIGILIEGFGNMISEAMSSIDSVDAEGVGSDLASMIIDGYRLIIPGLAAINTESWGSVKGAVSTAMSAVVDVVKKYVQFINNAMATFPQNCSTIFNAGVNAIKNAFGSIGSHIRSIWNNITSSMNDIVQNFKNIGRNMVEGLLNGFRNAWEKFKSTVTNLVNGLISGVQGLLGIHSPSRVFRGMAEQCVAGFSIGMQGLGDDVANNVQSAISSVNGEIASKYTVASNLEQTISTNGNNMNSYGFNDNGTSKIIGLLESYIRNGSGDTRIVLEGDAKSIFNVVRTENNVMKKATGFHALA